MIIDGSIIAGSLRGNGLASRKSKEPGTTNLDSRAAAMVFATWQEQARFNVPDTKGKIRKEFEWRGDMLSGTWMKNGSPGLRFGSEKARLHSGSEGSKNEGALKSPDPSPWGGLYRHGLGRREWCSGHVGQVFLSRQRDEEICM